MLDEIVPGRDLALEVRRVGVRQRAQPKIPLEGVATVEREGSVLLRGFHHRGVLEAVAEPEGAVVMEVVAQEHVGRRRLGRGGLECRVRFEQGHHRQPARVGDAQHADAAVVVLHVLDQPVDRVVRVGALVDGLGLTRVPRSPDHHERPLRLVPAANVLEDEDVAVVGQVLEVLAQRGWAPRSTP